MTDCVQVLTTAPSREVADRIARELVAQRLAACVQVLGPLASTYWWQGQIETAEEWLCVAKSQLSLYPRLEQAILSLHPYDVPEILALPIVAGSQSYLEWLRSELSEEKRAAREH